MKVLLINPPLAFPDWIYSSIPILFGQLQYRGFDATAIDMNVEFLKDVLSRDYLLRTKIKLEEIYKESNIDEQYKLFLEDILFNQEDKMSLLLSSTDDLYKKMLHPSGKQDEEFLQYLFSFIFASNYPSEIVFSSFEKQILTERNMEEKNNYKELISRCTNREKNIYIEYFENKINEINANQYDVIAISIPFETHLYPALTLAKILKEKTNAKIVIGGVIINSTIDSYIKYSDTFDMFVDAFLIGEGEKALLEYVKYASGEIEKDEVSGIVYKDTKTNKIVKKEMARISDIKEIKSPSYDGYNFEDYKNPLISLEFSKGCYWAKCVYCYSNMQKRYYIKNPIDAVDIISKLVEKYHIRKFSIIDDSLNINFALKFADEIIRRNLDINWIAFFRFEKMLTYEVLAKLKKAGLIGIFFGLESASKRILKLMNKGIDLKIAERILKDAHELGIESDLGIMFGFPTETKQDVLDTINFLKKNEEYIAITNIFYFTLLKSSGIFSVVNKLKMKNIREFESFSDYLFYDAPCVPRKELKEMLNEAGLFGLPIYTKR